MNKINFSKSLIKTYNVSKEDALVGVIEFQERLFERLKLNDFPKMEKFRLLKIIHSNIVDLLMMKLYGANAAINSSVIFMIEQLYEDMEEYVEELIDSPESIEQLNSTYSNIKYYIYPHDGYKRMYIMSDITEEEDMNSKSIKEPDSNYNLYKNVNWIRVPQLMLSIDSIFNIFDTLNDHDASQYFPAVVPKYVSYTSFYEELKNKDILIRVPEYYYKTILDFIDEMCTIPEILDIFITLYRFADDSEIIKSLVKARGLGKRVHVFIEPNARGNEEANREMSDYLYSKDVHVIYGCENLKVHAKMFLALDKQGRVYGHFGTGNYNEKTAKIYTDTHLLTSDPKRTNMALSIFMALSNPSELKSAPFIDSTDSIWFSPINLKTTIIGMILREIEFGEKGYIFLKVNSIIDSEILYFLKVAVDAGVRVEIICRSVCLFESTKIHPNLTIKSFCGRYLEHDRIYIFGERYFIASADLSFRNMHKRVETLIEIKDKYLKDISFTEIVNSIKVTQPHFEKNVIDNEWILRQ